MSADHCHERGLASEVDASVFADLTLTQSVLELATLDLDVFVDHPLLDLLCRVQLVHKLSFLGICLVSHSQQSHVHLLLLTFLGLVTWLPCEVGRRIWRVKRFVIRNWQLISLSPTSTTSFAILHHIEHIWPLKKLLQPVIEALILDFIHSFKVLNALLEINSLTEYRYIRPSTVVMLNPPWSTCISSSRTFSAKFSGSFFLWRKATAFSSSVLLVEQYLLLA